MTRALKILLIDDSEDDAILIERAIRRDGEACELYRVANAMELNSAIADQEWDVILCDYMMPEFSIEEALEALSQYNQDIPFIIVSGAIPDELAVELMRKGVHDYVTKNNLSRLLPAIKREIYEADQRSRRRLAEKQLSESEERYRRTFDSIPDNAYLWQLLDDGNIILASVNQTVRNTTRNAIEDFLGMNVLDIFPNVPWIPDTIRKVMNSNQPIRFEREFSQHPGSKRWSIWNFTKPADNLVLTISTDVTEVRDALNALKLSERELRSAKDRAILYLDLLGHDIRNQLQAILGGTEIAQELITDGNLLRIMKGVSDAATKCERIISKVKLTESLMAYPLLETDLSETLSKAVMKFSRVYPSAKMSQKIVLKKAMVLADIFLEEIWLNLMENSVEHNPHDKIQIWVELDETENSFQVTIADDGKGIPDMVKEGLFDVNRRFGGVSLHQTKEIVDKYGGTISVHDRVPDTPNQGAKFVIQFPKLVK